VLIIDCAVVVWNRVSELHRRNTLSFFNIEVVGAVSMH